MVQRMVVMPDLRCARDLAHGSCCCACGLGLTCPNLVIQAHVRGCEDQYIETVAVQLGMLDREFPEWPKIYPIELLEHARAQVRSDLGLAE